MPKGVLYINLAQWWPPEAPREHQENLWDEIKAGRKTSEFRDYTKHWKRRIWEYEDDDFARGELKVDRIWFMVGFPKGNLPRLEADITEVYVHDEDQIEIQFENVEEVTE